MKWVETQGLSTVPSPALLVDPQIVQKNIERMIEIVGGTQHVSRLRPHAKTHKMREISEMQVDAGITKFKAATLAEVTMLACAGAKDVLLAHQPVGPKIDCLRSISDEHPEVSFAAVVDNPTSVEAIAAGFRTMPQPLRLFIDVDCGMHRTGIQFGDAMVQLVDTIDATDAVQFAGLHVYDGHIHDAPLDVRQQRTGEIIDQVRKSGLAERSASIVGGGSPTFSVWAENTTWDCSPGTTLLWDHGYGRAFSDLGFEVAAALLSRVISKPGGNRVCLDLGHKAVAAEMPLDDRVLVPEFPAASFVGQSEEHLVLEIDNPEAVPVGQEVICIPRHICPTVALHHQAVIVRDGSVGGERWAIEARTR